MQKRIFSIRYPTDEKDKKWETAEVGHFDKDHLIFKGQVQKGKVGTIGPYQKAANVLALQEITRDFTNPKLNCRFKYHYGKLLLEIEDKEVKTTKVHDLAELFTTHLTHIRISPEFLKFFLKRCNEFKRVLYEKPKVFDESQRKKLYDQEFKRILQTKGEKQARSAEEEYKRKYSIEIYQSQPPDKMDFNKLYVAMKPKGELVCYVKDNEVAISLDSLPEEMAASIKKTISAAIEAKGNAASINLTDQQMKAIFAITAERGYYGDKTLWDQLMEDLPAYEYAVSSYTEQNLNQNINKVLRNLTSFASTLDKETLQEHLFYLFGSHVIQAAFQSILPPTGNVTAYRVEYHLRGVAKTLPLMRDAIAAAEDKSNTWIAFVQSNISTSQGELVMTVLKDEKEEPRVITNDEPGQIIVYQFPEAPQRLVDVVSSHTHEREIVFPPGMYKFTVETSLDDVVVIVKAVPVAPLEAEELFKKPEEGRVLHALEYVFEHYLSKPFAEVKAGDGDVEVVIKGIKVYKNNHGLAHAGRQGSYSEPVLQLIVDHGQPASKEKAAEILKNKPFLEVVKIAMFFFSSGREHERQHEHGELKAYLTAQARFSEYMKNIYLPNYLSLLRKKLGLNTELDPSASTVERTKRFSNQQKYNEIEAKLKKFINICSFNLAFSTRVRESMKNVLAGPHPMKALRDMGAGENVNPDSQVAILFKDLLADLTDEDKDAQTINTVCHVMLTCHNLDVPRFPLVKPGTEPDKPIVTNARTTVDGVLFKGFLPEAVKTDVSFQQSMNQLWALSRDRIAQTGDRLYDETTQKQTKDYDDMFAEVSLNPRKCAEVLGLDQSRTPILVCDPEKESVKDEAGLRFIYYQFQQLQKYPERIQQQLDEFLNESSKFFELFSGGIRFLIQHKDYKQTEQEDKINKQIQRKCFTQLMEETRIWAKNKAIPLEDFLNIPYIKAYLGWAAVDQLHAYHADPGNELAFAGNQLQFYLMMNQESKPELLDQFHSKHNMIINQIKLGGYTPLEYAFILERADLAIHFMSKHKATVTPEALKLLFSKPQLYSHKGLLAYFIEKLPMPLADFLKFLFENIDKRWIITYLTTLHKEKTSAIMIAAIQAGNYQAFAILINLKFIDRNKTDEHGRTLLHHAAILGDHHFVKLVDDTLPNLKKVKDKNGNTALHLFLMNAKNNNLDAVGVISLLSDSINKTNRDGLTPFDVLLRNQNFSPQTNERNFFLEAIDKLVQMNAQFVLQRCPCPDKIVGVAVRYSQSEYYRWSNVLDQFKNKDAYRDMTETVKCLMLDEIDRAIQDSSLQINTWRAPREAADEIVKTIIGSPSDEKKAATDNPQTRLTKLRFQAARLKFEINQLMPTINTGGNVNVSMELQIGIAKKLSELVHTMGALKLALKQANDLLLQPNPPKDLQKLITSTESSLGRFLGFVNNQTMALTTTLRSKGYPDDVNRFAYADPSRTLSVFHQIIMSRMQIYDKLGPEYYYADDSLAKWTDEENKPTAERLVAFLGFLNSNEELREQIARCQPKIMGAFYRAFSIMPEFKGKDIEVKAQLLIVDIMQPDEELRPTRFGLFAQNAGLPLAAAPSAVTDSKAKPPEPPKA